MAQQKRNPKSRFHGVSWHRRARRWQATITLPNGRQRYLGLWDGEQAAAVAYDLASWPIYHDCNRLNFPPPDCKELLSDSN